MKNIKADCALKYQYNKKVIKCERYKSCIRCNVFIKKRKRVYISETELCEHYKDIRDYSGIPKL